MSTKWSILSVTAINGLITEAKYKVVAKQDEFEVSTEGNWYFRSPVLKIDFSDVTEKMVIEWIKSEAIIDDKNIIELRLFEQIANLAKQKTTTLPWSPKVFTLSIED